MFLSHWLCKAFKCEVTCVSLKLYFVVCFILSTPISSKCRVTSLTGCVLWSAIQWDGVYCVRGKRGEGSNRGQRTNPDTPLQKIGVYVLSVRKAETGGSKPGWILHLICRSICAVPRRPCMGCCWLIGLCVYMHMYLVGIGVLCIVDWHLWNHKPSKVGVGVWLQKEPEATL